LLSADLSLKSSSIQITTTRGLSARTFEVIRGWVQLVENTKAKYGIQDEDTYNFDESGFMMGVISTEAVITDSDCREQPKTVKQGNREWTMVIQGINTTG
jgi:hypothetical protein